MSTAVVDTPVSGACEDELAPVIVAEIPMGGEWSRFNRPLDRSMIRGDSVGLTMRTHSRWESL